MFFCCFCLTQDDRLNHITSTHRLFLDERIVSVSLHLSQLSLKVKKNTIDYCVPQSH